MHRDSNLKSYALGISARMAKSISSAFFHIYIFEESFFVLIIKTFTNVGRSGSQCSMIVKLWSNEKEI